MTSWKDEVKKIKQCEQRQVSMNEQLVDLIEVANKLGFYDASDYLTSLVQKISTHHKNEET
jgi:hypothetical protein